MSRQADCFKTFDQNVDSEYQNEIYDTFVTLGEFKDFREAKDIAEELTMIMKVIDDQLEALKMLGPWPKMSKLGDIDKGLKGVNEDALLRRHMKRKAKIELLLKRADAVVKGIRRFIDLKQQRASISEARSLRRMAQEGEKQSATQMLFTVITIIFLPLQTLTSFFGLNAVELGTGDMRIGIVLAYIFPLSVMIIVLALFLGFNHNAREYFVASLEAWFEWLLVKLHIPRAAFAESTSKKAKYIARAQEQRKKPSPRRLLHKTRLPTTEEEVLDSLVMEQSDPESGQDWNDETSEAQDDESEAGVHIDNGTTADALKT